MPNFSAKKWISTPVKHFRCTSGRTRLKPRSSSSYHSNGSCGCRPLTMCSSVSFGSGCSASSCHACSCVSRARAGRALFELGERAEAARRPHTLVTSSRMLTLKNVRSPCSRSRTRFASWPEAQQVGLEPERDAVVEVEPLAGAHLVFDLHAKRCAVTSGSPARRRCAGASCASSTNARLRPARSIRPVDLFAARGRAVEQRQRALGRRGRRSARPRRTRARSAPARYRSARS